MKKHLLSKRLFSWLMVMAMVLSVVNIAAPLSVEAADGVTGITLGVPSWDTDRTQYTFPKVTVNMPEGEADKQMVFCISISDAGYFTAPVTGINDLDLSGVEMTEDGDKYVDNSGKDGITAITNSSKLITLTVIGSISDEKIINFIKGITFYRNGVDKPVEQTLSVVSSTFDVRKAGATAIAIDGQLHYYKYYDWMKEVTKTYKDGTTATIPQLETTETKWTWYNAYNLAKTQEVNGLKGYLATITSDFEQYYIFNNVGVEQRLLASYNYGEGAWIGGARTFISGETAGADDIVPDADTMPDLFYPAEVYNDRYNSALATKWRWMCGPEKGKVFYTTNSQGSYVGESEEPLYTQNKALYNNWNEKEPNNSSGKNKYDQEFCLQYGYTNDGKWNDWGPDHSPGASADTSEHDSYQAPLGFIVEFSPYDIDGDGAEDDGEHYTEPVNNDVTIISAQPHIVDAKLNKTVFRVGDEIKVKSVIGDNMLNESGAPNDELVNGKVPVYLWQVYNEDSKEWEEAKGTGYNTKEYTPEESDVGKKLRCMITATTESEDNPDEYVGVVYVDATGSDDQTNKIEGTTVVASDAVILKSGKLDPYKDNHKDDASKSPEHYLAGDKISVSNVVVIKGKDETILTGDDLTDGNLLYQWQWSPSGDKGTWKNIEGANSVSLSDALTEQYAGNKIQVVISAKDGGKYATNVTLYVDGDGYATAETGGTYIDKLTIDGSDFIVTLDKAKTMTEGEAETAADVTWETSCNLNNSYKDVEPTTKSSDVGTTLNTVTEPGDVNVTFNATLNGANAADGTTHGTANAKDKDDTTKIGKTVVAHVTDSAASNTGADGKKVSIGANNITVSVKTAKTFVNAATDKTHAGILGSKAGVVVVDDGTTVSPLTYLDTNPTITISYPDGKTLKAEAGEYYVIYTYTNVSGTSVSTTAKVYVKDTAFDVTPENPDDPTNPTDGIEGPDDDPGKTDTDTDIYKVITIPYSETSVKLVPEAAAGVTIEKLTDKGTEVTPLPADGAYTINNIAVGTYGEVVYTTKNIDGEIRYHYTIKRSSIPEIVEGQLNVSKFEEGKEIKVTKVYAEDDGNTSEIASYTDSVTYQWEKYDDESNIYKPITGATGSTYTPDGTVVKAGDTVRVKITGNGTDYIGTVYVKAGSSTKATEENANKKDTGSEITDDANPRLDAHDFLISKTEAGDPKDNKLVEYGGAEATDSAGNPVTPVVTTESKAKLQEEAAKDDPSPVTVTYKNSDLTKPVTATILDNVTTGTGDDSNDQIGSNDYEVQGKSAAQTIADVINNGNVTVVENGEKKGNKPVSDYTVAEAELKKLNDAIAANEPETVTVNVTDTATGLTTPVKVTIKPVSVPTSFTVTPTNPDNPGNPSDGVTGPTPDASQSSGNDYVYTIHLDSDVDSVLLTPAIENGDVTKFEVSNDTAASASSLDTDKKYTVKNITSDETVTVKYTVTNTSNDSVSTYTYIIDRAKAPNINVDTNTSDPTPGDSSDDPIIDDSEEPKEVTNEDGTTEMVKDIKITVPNKVTSIEIIPTPEDPDATFITGYGDNGLKVEEGTKVDTKTITTASAKFTLTELKTDEDSVASVKVKSADGSATCIYRYTVIRAKNNDATIKDTTTTPDSTATEKTVEITTLDSSYTWPIVLNDSNAAVTKIEKTSGDGTLVVPDGKKSFTVNDLDPNKTTVIKVTTVAENGTDTITYLVKITRTENTAGEKGVPEIEEVDVKDNDNNDQPADVKITTSNDKNTVDITVPANQTDYSFHVQTGPLSQITEITKINGPANIESANDGFKATGLDDKTPTVVTVKVTEVSGDTRTYTVTIYRAQENVTPTVTDDMNGGTINLKDYLPESVRNNAKEIIYHCCAHTVLAIDKDGTARAMRRNPNSMNNSLVHIIVKGYDNKYTDYTVFFHVTGVTKEEEYGTLVKYKGINYELTGDNTCRVSSWKTNAAIKKKNVVIPASIKVGKKTYKVTEIAPAAFLNNSKIQQLTIGKNVKTIGNTSFVGMSKLNKFVVAKGNKYFRTAGKSGNSAKMLLTKNKKTLIAMSNVKGKVTLPKTVTRVTEYAGAANYKMKELVIPKNVKRIDPCAFAHATKMKKVTFKGKLPEMSNNCILDRMNYKKGTVTVPKKYYNAYKKAFQSASKKRYGLKQFPDMSHLKKSK